MSSNKIPSLRKSVLSTLLALIGIPVIWFFFLDFPMVGMSETMARKLSQIGVYINLVSALSMIVRFLWLDSYNRRLEVIYSTDDSFLRQYEYSKHHIYDEKNAIIAQESLEAKQAPLYEEVNNYNKFERVETIHLYLGITGLLLGSILQILSAG